VLGEEAFPLPNRIHRLVQNGQRITLGFRREAVTVSAEKRPGEAVQLRGEIEALEPDYASRTQVVYIRNGAWTYTGQCPLETKLALGQQVHCEVDTERLYFFDGESGARL
jgi:ABC-type sugar transport system ATPase subunit